MHLAASQQPEVRSTLEDGDFVCHTGIVQRIVDTEAAVSEVGPLLLAHISGRVLVVEQVRIEPHFDGALVVEHVYANRLSEERALMQELDLEGRLATPERGFGPEADRLVLPVVEMGQTSRQRRTRRHVLPAGQRACLRLDVGRQRSGRHRP